MLQSWVSIYVIYVMLILFDIRASMLMCCNLVQSWIIAHSTDSCVASTQMLEVILLDT